MECGVLSLLLTLLLYLNIMLAVYCAHTYVVMVIRHVKVEGHGPHGRNLK